MGLFRVLGGQMSLSLAMGNRGGDEVIGRECLRVGWCGHCRPHEFYDGTLLLA